MAKNSYLNFFPKPLLEDLLRGNWIPVIGAGFSVNADLHPGKKIPLWDEVGKNFAKEIDSISAFSHEFSRAKLVEKLSEILLVDDSRPGQAHIAFAKIPFEIVCTTNFDFLLERAYENIGRYCHPVLDEDQLAINSKDSSVTLLKIHGDLHHPQRMVVTEEDYDLFLDKYPLIATYLANLMITKTPVFIGYSLDDPDFRMIWQTVSDRLGQLRRPAYVILVDANSHEVSRFERRGVKVINLSGKRENYNQILANTFTNLRDYIRQNILPISQVTENEPLQELSLPENSANRICFFAIPFSLLPFYKEKVFPVIRENGLVPLTAEEVISPGETIVAKIDALIQKSAMMVVDAANKYTLYELKLALANFNKRNVLIISPDINNLPIDLKEYTVITRTEKDIVDPENLLLRISNWAVSSYELIKSSVFHEPTRLLEAREYRAAVISAYTLLEITLKEQIQDNLYLLKKDKSSSKITTIRLAEFALQQEKINSSDMVNIKNWAHIRNSVVHTNEQINNQQAKQIVNGILDLINKIKRY